MLGLLLAGAAVAQPVKASETERMEVRPEAPALPEGPTVTAVELHLPADEDSAGLVELVAVRKGQALSVRAVRRSVERLWNSGRFSDIVVRTVDEPEGVRVVFELTLLRKLHRVDVEGNVVLSDEALRAVLRKEGIEEGKPLDEDVPGL